MNFYTSKKKYLTVFLYFCVLFLQPVCSNTAQSILNNTIQWNQRMDVNKAVKQLKNAHLALDIYVQRIYNAYAPHTIGEGKVMRDRMKDLERLITLAGNVEGIFCFYEGVVETTRFRKDEFARLKKHILFYYIDQESRMINIESTVVRQLLFALEALYNSKWHPDFVRVTNFNKDEAIRIIMQVDNAINAAIATIPGGLN